MGINIQELLNHLELKFDEASKRSASSNEKMETSIEIGKMIAYEHTITWIREHSK